MTRAPAADAARGPLANRASDDSALFARFEKEPVAASEKDFAEALGALASLLLDSADRGEVPTPLGAKGRPDERARGARAQPHQGEAA